MPYILGSEIPVMAPVVDGLYFIFEDIKQFDNHSFVQKNPWLNGKVSNDSRNFQMWGLSTL
jgi:hypothetical protein